MNPTAKKFDEIFWKLKTPEARLKVAHQLLDLARLGQAEGDAIALFHQAVPQVTAVGGRKRNIVTYRSPTDQEMACCREALVKYLQAKVDSFERETARRLEGSSKVVGRYCQDGSVFTGRDFEKLVKLLQVHGWTNVKISDAMGIWDDQFSTPGDVCGSRKLNWSSSWRTFRAFYEASRVDKGLFTTEKSLTEFFCAHFLFHANPPMESGERTLDQVRSGARQEPLQNEKYTAQKIVSGLRRMLQLDSNTNVTAQ